MEREKRLEALCMAGEGEVVELADRVLESLPVDVSRGPSVGLLMMRLEEPSERLPFNFTEVTVSEAEVAAGPHRGFAMVMGRSPEKALAIAILDAASQAGHTLRGEIDELAEVSIKRDWEHWQSRWAEVAPSMARFEDVTE